MSILWPTFNFNVNLDWLKSSNSKGSIVETVMSNNLAMLSVAATLSISIPLTMLYTYHLYLMVPRKGEVKIRWSYLPILGHALEMGQRPIELLQESAKECGEIFGLLLGGQRIFIISDCFSSDLIIRPSKDYSWEEFHDSVLTKFFGVREEIAQKHDMLEGDLMRKWYSQYLLSDKHLNHLTHRVFDQLRRDMDHVQTGRHPFYKFISRIIFRASIVSFFNENAAGEANDLYENFNLFDDRMALALAGCPLNFFKGAVEAREKVAAACGKYTENQCELMKARWEFYQEKIRKGLLTEDDLTHFQLSIFWASVSNTMPAAFWTILYLLQQPDLLKDVLDEIKSQAPDYYSTRSVTIDMLNNMTLLDACFTETLRLSSGSLIMRHIKRDCQLTLASGNTYKFRKGDRIGMCPPIFHRDGEIFAEPDEFRPRRWLQSSDPEERKIAAETGKMPLFKAGREIPNGKAFLPFGAGVTYCPGRRFARVETKTMVVFLLMEFDFALPPELQGKKVDCLRFPGFDASRAGIGIFPPKDDIDMMITRKMI